MTTASTTSGIAPRAIASGVSVGISFVLACLAILSGLAYAAMAVGNGVTAQVPVRLGPQAPASMAVVLPCVEGWSLEGSSCRPAASPDEWPGGESLPVRHTGGLVTSANEVDPLTSLLSTSGVWAGLVVAGAVVLVLLPVLRMTADGRPFASGNDRRLATAAALTVLGWLVAVMGPAIAAPRALDLLTSTPRSSGFETYDMPIGWLVPDLRLTWWPLLIAVLLAALAAATRRGTRLSADTEGLV